MCSTSIPSIEKLRVIFFKYSFMLNILLILFV
jgi:hypothetical protein